MPPKMASRGLLIPQRSGAKVAIKGCQEREIMYKVSEDCSTEGKSLEAFSSTCNTSLAD